MRRKYGYPSRAPRKAARGGNNRARRDAGSLRCWGVESLEPRELLSSQPLPLGEAGLLGSYYDDEALQQFVDTRVDPVVDFPNDALGDDALGMVASDDYYSIRWTGAVLVDQAGDWQFTTFSNDGVRLWADDTQLIDHWNNHTVARDDGSITLDAGWHPITLEYYQHAGTSHIELMCSGPGFAEAIIPSTHLRTDDPGAGAPVADAGPDRVVLLPDDSVKLNGSGTDPDGTIEAYAWAQESGPNTATLTGADTPDLTAGDLIQGEYVFSLTVTDNDGKTDTDEATVLVVQSGTGGVISGELKKWHKVTVTFDGPATGETAATNPFTDYRLNVTFSHSASGKSYVVPGYYAADGDAANTSAESGTKWRVHFTPDEEGTWTYLASFRTGANVAVSDDPGAGTGAGYFDGAADSFDVGPTDKTGRDLRGKGRLEYVGGHYLRFAETGEYFLKQGADAPENFLACEDFDGGFKSDGISDNRIKSWAPHAGDWNPGDPAWQGDKGTEIIGAINYLAGEGMNAFSFIPMNIGGDDKNVFPYLDYDERYRMDVSRLDQWEIVFEHADTLGMFLHFKTQETENELLLDGGDLGVQRKLYYRELIARFGHHLALNWNLGEEINNATTAQKRAWAAYFWDHDPYRHHVVIHNGANHYDLLGGASELTGFSLQTSNADFTDVHDKVRNYLTRSSDAGKPWAVACDEPGDASHALRPDDDAGTSHEDGRKNALWGTLLAGGWGNEWYFGYAHHDSDLTCEDFRSRDAWWDYCRYALAFFNDNEIPFWEMHNDNAISSAANDYGFVKPGEVYVVYLKDGGTTDLDLSGATGTFDVQWFDPRNGGPLEHGTVVHVDAGGPVSIGLPPDSTSQDWVALVTPAARVVDRHVFYNNSAFDGNDPAASTADDGAIAPDKTALLSGQTATFANYTSYSNGINGIVIDVAGLPGTPTADDFTFRMGNDDDPDSWPPAPTPANEDITVRPGAGTDGSDRITIVWPDYDTVHPDPATQAVAKQWLQVTVLATANTGLAEPDVFYWGNAVGDSGLGNFGERALVNAVDSGAVRDNPHNPFVDPAPIDDFADYNRDQWVNAVDFGFVRDNATNPTTALRLITAPVAGTSAGPERAAPFPARFGRAALHDAVMGEPDGNLILPADAESDSPGLSCLDASALRSPRERAPDVADPTRAAVEKLLSTL